MPTEQPLATLHEQTDRLRPSLGSSFARALWPLALAIVVGWLMFHVVGPQVGSYKASIAVIIGIYIILAVSLTVVNGFTGQFSMGHAGFMAVGGYTAASIVYYGSMKLWGTADFVGGALSYSGLDETARPLIA